jgi:hypothetical protein
MAVNYSKAEGVGAGISKTFDGKHPCSLIVLLHGLELFTLTEGCALRGPTAHTENIQIVFPKSSCS